MVLKLYCVLEVSIWLENRLGIAWLPLDCMQNDDSGIGKKCARRKRAGRICRVSRMSPAMPASVIPTKAGPQYAAAHRLHRWRLRLLDPRFRGDDGGEEATHGAIPEAARGPSFRRVGAPVKFAMTRQRQRPLLLVHRSKRRRQSEFGKTDA
jgi:hypothetical protein